MATAATEKVIYPHINEAAWWKLRKKFKERLPGVVDAPYLRGVLGYNEKSARNLIPQLKSVGLIDDDGKPTDLANRWRNDNQYAAVCEEIVDAVYPPGLRDAFHDADSSRDDVADWLAHATKSGEGTAQGFARFYLLLLKADASAAEVKAAPAKTPTRSPQKEAGAHRRRPQNAARTEHTARTEDDQEEHASNGVQPPRAARSINPSVHLDFNIHIAPDSEPELIESIFASMAKHLRSLLNEAGE